jgi:hypothetical protein
MKPFLVGLASCAAMFANGCATQLPAPLPPPMPQLPADGAGVDTWLNAQRVICRDSVNVARPPSYSTTDTRIRPTYTRQCSTEFPSALLRRDIEAACHVKFDIDAGGIPVAPFTTCNVAGAASNDVAVVQSMYLALAQKVVTTQRFLPLQAERDGAVRTRVLQRIRFVIATPRPSSPQYPSVFAQMDPSQPEPFVLN